MKQSKYLALLIFIFSLQLGAQPIIAPICNRGDEVCNGGGIAEQNLVHAYTHLEDYVSVCLQTNLCDLTREQTKILKDISGSLKKEYSNAKQIVFKSESKEPGTFIIDGELKVAKTGNDVASPIYFNLDLLYSKNSLGSLEPISIPQAISILVHEMGHHHNIKDHAKLDLLGNKVAATAGKRFITTALHPYDDDIKISVFNKKESNAHPTVLLYVYEQIIDLSYQFKSNIECNLAGVQKQPIGSVFYNIFWADIKYGSNFRRYIVKGNLANECRNGEDLLVKSKNHKVLIKFYLQPDKGCTSTICTPRWIFKDNSVEMDQIYEPWWTNGYLKSSEL
jgi:hypothetical protein